MAFSINTAIGISIVAFGGSYSGVLKEWVYSNVVLAKDPSN